MKDQSKDIDKGGTMRLGAYDCVLKKGSLAHRIYNKEKISERHRHRLEVNNDYIDILEKKGLRFSGKNTKFNLVEIIEIEDHPFFIAGQFHPEFKSKPVKPHPMFREFIIASTKTNIN